VQKLEAPLSLSSTRRKNEVIVYAAGSLRDAVSEIGWTFTDRNGVLVRTAFGYSGVLRRWIESGEKADLFASADVGHPQTLLAGGYARETVVFARNALCAVAIPRIGLTEANLLDRMLDPNLVLGVFPSNDDPLGDYTRTMFRRCEALRAGSFARLQAKAKIVSPEIMRDVHEFDARDLAGLLLKHGVIDVHVCYRSTAHNRLAKSLPQMDVVELPAPLQVEAEYALAVLRDAAPATADLARFILSSRGQAILLKYGFMPAEQSLAA